MKKLILFTGLTLSKACLAGSLLVHTQSWHTASGFNNENYGAAYCTDESYCIGTYRNSYKNQTIYAIKDFYSENVFGFVAGVANGYNLKNPHKVQFIAALSLNTKIDDHWSTKLLVQPAVKSSDASVVHLVVKVSF